MTIALVVITILSWTYVAWLALDMASSEIRMGEMPGMDMSGMGRMNMGDVVAPDFQPWALADFAFIFAMWAVMMVGMMTPSVSPMVLLYARVGRNARTSGKPFAATGWFFAGYLLVWVVFSILATAAQWALATAALLSPMMAGTSATLGGIILIAAGLYQWTPVKAACLRQCQAPISFLSSHGGFRADPFGALRLGINHGVYCLGCCWALMALLFVGGVMNVVWIAGLAALVLLEKTIPARQLVPRLSGLLMASAGVWLLVFSTPA